MFGRIRPLALALGICVPALADETLEPEPPPFSLGQPQRVQFMWGPIAGYDFHRDQPTSRIFVDVIGKGRSPQFGIGDQTIEIAFGHAGSEFDVASSLYLKVPLIHVGVEWSSVHQEFEPSFSARYAIPRGGLFHNGDLLRLDWRPWQPEWMLGIAFNWPLHEYRRHRPRSMHVEIPGGDVPATPDHLPVMAPEVRHSLDEIAHAVMWMDRYLTPRFQTADDFEESAEGFRRHLREDGHTYAREVTTYHRALGRAFGSVLGDEAAGVRIAEFALSVIWDEIVVPYNRLFAQNKSPAHLGGYVRRALPLLATVLEEHPDVKADEPDETMMRVAACTEIFRRTLECIDRVARDSAARWRQSHLFWLKQARLVWLPLELGLLPEQHDSQEEWDAILAELTEQSWFDANRVEYLLNNQFHLALKRMIRETERYQVMIIHDFRGRLGWKTDTIGWDVVADGYLAAFTEAVEELDRGERTELPRFYLFLDEHFYAANYSRPVITFLERIWEGDIPKLDNGETLARVREAQRRLVEAVRSSAALGDLDDETLAGLFKIHVSVTNPYDPAFTFDSIVRDHRKLAFRDVTEADPGSGEGIITGQGVGEHYNGPSWEDRSVAVRGPALVTLKDETRRLCRQQGYRTDEMPRDLEPIPYAADWEEQCQQLREQGWTTPVLTTMNDTGYGEKKSSVLKAAMYNLLPAGGFLFSLDSLWISDYWAGMFISAALRGGHLYPIGPASENAPSSALPVMVLMRDTLEMMVRAGGFFREEIEAAGGSLRVGLYDHDVPVDDLRRRTREFLEGRERYPFLADLFPLHPTVLAALERSAEQEDPTLPFAAAPVRRDVSSVDLEAEHKPYIHLKGHLVASRSAIRILERPEWLPVLRSYLAVRRLQVRGLPNPGVTPRLLSSAEDGQPDLLTAWRDDLAVLPPEERDTAIFLLTVGSQNQDRLSMLSNGEVLVSISGHDALVSLTDFMFILGTAAWPADPDELEEVFRRPGGLGVYLRRVFQWIQDMV
jgi:hypothetical protein